jgi:hypothetical protein
VPLSNYSIDTFVAPHLSELTSVGAPDLRGCTEEYGHWVNNFILNTIFRVRLKERNRQLVLYFLRKVEGAFQEYHEGRDFLASYLQKRNEAVSAYFHALRHFEVAASLAYQAYDTVRTMVQEKLFTQDDGSPLQRLNRLQNISKHANKELGRGGIPDNLSVPIWLTNTAIECHDTVLSFSEFAELMEELARLAEVLSNPPLNKEESTDA